MPGLDDERKDFVVSSLSHHLEGRGVSRDAARQALLSAPEVDAFLDDSRVTVLQASVQDDGSGAEVKVSNQLGYELNCAAEVHFVKTLSEPVTPSNMHKVLQLMSMPHAPTQTLYNAIHHVYAPLLLRDEKWAGQVDSKVQKLLAELEKGLSSAVRQGVQDSRGTGSDDDLSGIVEPTDEFRFWQDRSDRDGDAQAAAFWELFEPLYGPFRSLDSKSVSDAMELIDLTQDQLNSLWESDLYKYPDARMKHLFVLLSAAFAQFIQGEFQGIDVWTHPFVQVRDKLRDGLDICEKWSECVHFLTVKYWPTYAAHPWTGGKAANESLTSLHRRLEELMTLRTVHEQLLNLLTPSEQAEFDVTHSFKSFEGLRPLHYNPYTETQWRAAVTQYEKNIAPIENRIASKLRMQFQGLSSHPAQMVREFTRYTELVRRPTIAKELTGERSALLAELDTQLNKLHSEFSQGQHTESVGKNLPDHVTTMVALRQTISKVDQSLAVANSLLSDLQGVDTFRQSSEEFLGVLRHAESEAFDDWKLNTTQALQDPDNPIALEMSGRLMELDFNDGKLRVNYSDKLVALLREVRQLSALAFSIPSDIRKAADQAQQFYCTGVILKQVANFYNTIGSQMIHSQKSMLLDLALRFEDIVKNPTGKSGDGNVTWSDPRQVEAYIEQLKGAADALSSENRRLRKVHQSVSELVIRLMDISLLRDLKKWKDVVDTIRAKMEALVQAGYKPKNMLPWRTHWDYQIYKSMEHQFQLGLESLNQNLPEIKVELTFKQQRLQFKPSFEDIRAKYYREMRKFISLPMHFKGVGGASGLYQRMLDRNSSSLAVVYRKASDLFVRLFALLEEYEPWTVLGTIDLDTFVEERLHEVGDWEGNFKMLKTKAKEAEKLPNEIQVDCIHVSLTPVKNIIESHFERLTDALVISLRRSAAADLKAIETFTTKGLEQLARRPQSAEEISEFSGDYQDLVKEKVVISSSFSKMEDKNKLLRNVAGGGLDLSHVQSEWQRFLDTLEAFDLMMEDQKESLRAQMQTRISGYNTEVSKFMARWQEFKPKSINLEREAADTLLQGIEEQQAEFDELLETGKKVEKECEYFQLEVPNFEGLEKIKDDMAEVQESWKLYSEYRTALDAISTEKWIEFRAHMHDFDDFVSEWMTKLKNRIMERPRDPMSLQLNESLEEYRKMSNTGLLKFCRGDAFTEDHWRQLFGYLDIKGLSTRELLFQHLIDKADRIIAHEKEIKTLHAQAQGEATIREAFEELRAWKMKTEFQLTPHGEGNKATVLIKEWKEVMTQVGDNQSLLASLKDSSFFKPFEDEATIWEQKLGDLDEYLRNLNLIQRKWVYLEPIFGRGALPQEQSRFRNIDSQFRSVMDSVKLNPQVTALTDVPAIRNTLQMMLNELERCQKALNQYLEEKRSVFPRFYFIGDDDLLEILGQAKRPAVIQSHLKKLFQGISKVQFSDDNTQIVAMKSSDNELVPLSKPVNITDRVEEWLSDLSEEMKSTLKQLLVKCVNGKAFSPASFPSQILCLSELIHFTVQCEEAIKSNNLSGFKKTLQKKLSEYTSIDTHADRVLDLKVKALVLDLIHNIDVVDQLTSVSAKNTDDWQWQKQLRFYLEKDIAIIRMCDARFEYSYEYQGNAAKLVHTPLTDKCYLTLTQAMHLGYGGAPYGPAGTGKTESVKALGTQFGRQILVFNCDEGIDFKSMGRIFTGLVKCGAWGCFDEFNRLEEEVLSAVSTQIQVIQSALKAREPSLELLGSQIDVNANAGIFVTMNPAGKGYGGRQKLPDNLKALFRQVSMSKPDNDLIAETILYSEGFKTAKVLGRQLVSVFTLSKQLLSPQQHYDWGLRALKTVLRVGGALIQREKKAKNEITPQLESELIIQSLRVNTLSKLTFADYQRFVALIGDVFPGVKSEDIVYQDLETAIKETLAEMQLVHMDMQTKKIVQFYEALNQRMGVVIVGPSGCGKTTMWQVLKSAMKKMNRKVVARTLNAKAMPRTQLLGHMDLDTREWFDGVLTQCARDAVNEESDVQSWIICDGDIDPEWIESLNSVLDDNHLLTMPSGERIQFGNNVNFIFECDSLQFASPATVSRMGMIFLSDEDMEIKSLVASYLQRADNPSPGLDSMINDFFYRALDYAERNCDSIVDTTRAGLALNGLSHVIGSETKSEFCMGLIRGLGGNMPAKQQAQFAGHVYTLCGEKPADPRRPLNTCTVNGNLAAYQDDITGDLTLEHLRDTPVVRTIDVQRCADLIRPWFDTPQTFILVGPEGVGKTMVINHVCKSLRNVNLATIHCNAQTTSQHVIDKLRQTCSLLTTNTGRVYKPKDCERLVLYLRDLNLPKPDKYSTIQLIAFLRQVVTYGGFYNEELEWVSIDKERVQIVASMNPPTTAGRHALSTRFTAIVRMAYFDYPERESLTKVYSEILRVTLSRDLANHKSWKDPSNAAKLAASTVEIYDQVRSRFSVDDHAHYGLTPRHVTEWATGLLRYDLTDCDVIAAWAHEGARIFRDRLVGTEGQRRFDTIFQSVVQSHWGNMPDLGDTFFTSWANEGQKGGERLLGRMSNDTFYKLVKRGLKMFERDVKELHISLFLEVLDHVSRVDRVLSTPGGSLLVTGRSGVGRRSAVALATHMHRMTMVQPNMSREYTIKSFKADLKQVLQQTGVDGEQVVFFVEDFHLANPEFLEIINSLLCAGEAPGLYEGNEIDQALGPLKEEFSNANFEGGLYAFFIHRVQQNLHIVVSMDPSHEEYVSRTQRNPALFTRCSIQWWDSWSRQGMLHVPKVALKDLLAQMEDKDKFLEQVFFIHESRMQHGATPRGYIALLDNFRSVYESKRDATKLKTGHLEAGLSKLSEASQRVDVLKEDATKQQAELAEAQEKADKALERITKSMERAGERKQEVEQLQATLGAEEKKLHGRKTKVEEELAEVQPLLDEAKQAVGQIRSDNLTEIRNLRAPPNAIRDVLEGVLRLMGIFDTSWTSMRKFLGNRGVKDEIINFDTRKVTPDIRKDVQTLLKQKGDSFRPEVIKKASVAAAPLASWVKAQLAYSKVVETVAPLERELASAEAKLQKSRNRVIECEKELGELNAQVDELKIEFNKLSDRASELKYGLKKANQILEAAQTLLSKLSGEEKRWVDQVRDLKEELRTLPTSALLAAAFTTYLANATEDVRAAVVQEWSNFCNLDKKFRFANFMSTESEQLKWKAEGLPGDHLSIENANMILNSTLTPIIIDPATQATQWLQNHFAEQKVKVLLYQDERFIRNLEIAVRFGETLVIQEVDEIDPILYPLLRRDLVRQGPRFVVQLGDKSVDYNENFKLYLVTRNPNPRLPPDAASVLLPCNFSITRSGLEGQLLGVTIQNEKPELEEKKSESLRTEEELKVQIADLEKQLLERLATSEGNILENKPLIDSLNETKSKSQSISKALKDSQELQDSLDVERDVYRPIAKAGSTLFFLIRDLAAVNSMYQFSLATFSTVFKHTLEQPLTTSTVEERIHKVIAALQVNALNFVTRSLFKKDQLTFAMHIARGMNLTMFQENEWEAFTGQLVAEPSAVARAPPLPSWASPDRQTAWELFATSFPTLVRSLAFDDTGLWGRWSKSPDCESEFPKTGKAISGFQKLLIVQALRPDRLQSSMAQFSREMLGVKTLAGPPLNFERTVKEESNARTPILVIISPGADPSQELEDTATRLKGPGHYHQVAMGQGQQEIALRFLQESARNGDWVILKNLHLVTSWLPILEKEINILEPHADFRLWLTTESTPRFPSILLQNSLKLTYEAPPGLKKNLQRSYESWTPDFIAKGSSVRAQLLMVLAWFHATVQERRTYLPQGWCKFYEFSPADLRSAADIIDANCTDGKLPDWITVRGLFENAVYGGHIDNPADLRVLRTYLKQFFNSDVISISGRPPSKKLYKGLAIPTSTHHADYVQAIGGISDAGQYSPSLFGLPDNVDRSVQINASTTLIKDLKTMAVSSQVTTAFDRDAWNAALQPVLSLWNNLIRSNESLLEPVRELQDNMMPLNNFVFMECSNAHALVKQVHASLSHLGNVLQGTSLLTPSLKKEAEQIIAGSVPLNWQSKWEGPESVTQWLGALVKRGVAVDGWRPLAESGRLVTSPVALADLFRPGIFLNALRQHTARQVKCSMDSLRLAAQVNGKLGGCAVPVTVTGLRLQGASFHSKLTETGGDEAVISVLPDCSIGWIPKDVRDPYPADSSVPVPIYSTIDREAMITEVRLPCDGDQNKWILSGVALFVHDA